MHGLHLTADLLRRRCEPERLTDGAALARWCLAAVRAAGLRPVDQLFHAFPATKRGSAA